MIDVCVMPLNPMYSADIGTRSPLRLTAGGYTHRTRRQPQHETATSESHQHPSTVAADSCETRSSPHATLTQRRLDSAGTWRNVPGMLLQRRSSSRARLMAVPTHPCRRCYSRLGLLRRWQRSTHARGIEYGSTAMPTRHECSMRELRVRRCRIKPTRTR